MFKLMVKYVVVFFLLVQVSCSRSNRELHIEQIKTLHRAADSATLGSRLIHLQEARYLLATMPLTEDSLRINNFFRLGQYYRERGIVDSAATQYFSASLLLKDSILTEVQKNVFYEGWEAFLTLKKYGDCFTLANRYLALTLKNNFSSRALGFYMKENTFKETRQFDSAYFYNAKRIAALSEDKDESLVVPALISKAQYLYYDFDDVSGTFAILDSIKNSSWKLTHDFNRQLYGNYGVYLFYENKKAEALASYLLGLQAAKQIPDGPDKKTLLAYPYANISEVLIDLNRLEDARKYLDSAVNLGFSNIDRDVQNSILKYKFNLTTKTNSQPREVIQLLDSVLYAMDAQYQNKFEKELSALSVATKNEQQLIKKNTSTQIENLKLQTRLLFVLLGSMILAGIGVYFYRKRTKGFQKMQLQMQQRLLRTQMNPHYTSNSLYAIGRIIKKSPEKATEYLVKFSRQLRLVMENSVKNKVLLEQEILALKGYLDLQKYRLKHDLKYTINYVDLEEDDPVFIPPMLIQPFVENAIEHGFKDIDYLAEINITIKQSTKTLLCTIKDNGLGIPTPIVERKNSSTGLINEFIKKTTKTVVRIQNNSSAPGVLTTFQIPYYTTDDT